MRIWRVLVFAVFGAVLLLACSNEIIVVDDSGSGSGTDSSGSVTPSGTIGGTTGGTTNSGTTSTGTTSTGTTNSGTDTGSPPGSMTGTDTGTPPGTMTGLETCYAQQPQDCYPCVCQFNMIGCQNYQQYLFENIYCGMSCTMTCDPFCQTVANGVPDFGQIDQMCQDCFDELATTGGPDVDAFFAACQQDPDCVQLFMDWDPCG